MRDCIDDILFSGERPETLEVLACMEAGLEPHHLTKAWEARHGSVPCLEKQLTEVRTVFPYARRAIERVLADSETPDSLLLFAARDAENLYDVARIIAPERATRLLPASGEVWRTLLDTSFPKEYQSFLKKFGVDSDFVSSDEARVRIVDTGFRGSVGASFVRATKRILGADVGKKTSVHLICHMPENTGVTTSQILPDDAEGIPFPQGSLPLTGHLLDLGGGFVRDSQRASFRCATALQNMPRFHGPFYKVAVRRRSGGITMQDTLHTDFDGPRYEINTSVHHPYAAAVVQMAFIQLSRSSLEA